MRHFIALLGQTIGQSGWGDPFLMVSGSDEMQLSSSLQFVGACQASVDAYLLGHSALASATRERIGTRVPLVFGAFADKTIGVACAQQVGGR